MQPGQLGRAGCCTPGSEQRLSQPGFQDFRRSVSWQQQCLNLGSNLRSSPTGGGASCPGPPLTARRTRCSSTARLGLLPGPSIKSDGWSCSLVYRFDHHHWASPDTSAFLAIPLTLDPPAALDCSGAARCRAARPAAPRIRHWPWRCGGNWMLLKIFEFQDI